MFTEHLQQNVLEIPKRSKTPDKCVKKYHCEFYKVKPTTT